MTLPRGRPSHDRPQQQSLVPSRQRGLSPLRAEEPCPCGPPAFAGWSPTSLEQAHPWPARLTPPLLLSSASQALQCHSFQHIYFGPFDLSGRKFLNVSCLHGCSEAVLSLDTGEGRRMEEKGVGERLEREVVGGAKSLEGQLGRSGGEG